MQYQHRLSKLVPDLPQGWYGYESTYGNSCRITLRNGLYTRNARCKDCRVLIPAKVPRFHLHAPWRYMAGNYCIECGTKRVERAVGELTSNRLDREKKIMDLNSIVKVGNTIINNEGYKNRMAISRLGRQLER